MSRIDIRSAQQAQFLRRSIELEVVRILAEAPDGELIKRLRAVIARQARSLDAGDYDDFVQADQSFHRDMYEAAHVPELWDLVRRNSGHIDRLRRLHVPVPGKGQAIVRDHTAIVQAIAKGDCEAAQARLRKHLSGTLSRVDEIRARFPSYVTN